MENLKSWKTTAVGVSQLILGVAAFVLWVIGEIDVKELAGSIAFIVWFGGIVGNLFAKDSDVTHSDDLVSGIRKMDRTDIGGDGLPESEID